jgi:FtsH-binding integral membrane protein
VQKRIVFDLSLSSGGCNIGGMQNNLFGTNTLPQSQELVTARARFMSRVYMWMAMGLLTTGAVSYSIGMREDLAMTIASNRGLFWVLFLAQIGAVIFLGSMIRKISSGVATLLYGLYAALTGVTLSVIFLIYTHESIVQVFGITSFAFAGLSGFGYLTKKDLGPVGSFCIMGLWGLIGVAIASIFFPMGEQIQLLVSVVGLVVFSGLTAYDTQKIKNMYHEETAGDGTEKAAIFGALILYLDFINLFMYMLRFMGGRRK